MKGDQILNESVKQNFVWIGWIDVAENENTINMLIHKKRIKQTSSYFIFTHQWTRQPSPFSRESCINMMLSLKY